MGERARVCESVVNWKFRSGAVELDMAVNSVKEEEESKEHWTTMRGNVQRKALREDISTKGVTCDWRQQEVKEYERRFGFYSVGVWKHIRSDRGIFSNL